MPARYRTGGRGHRHGRLTGSERTESRARIAPGETRGYNPSEVIIQSVSTVSTSHSVPARAGLLGNPSDGYGGACIAIGIWNFTATIRCSPADGVHFVPNPRDRPAYAGLQELRERIRRYGYYGGIRLLMAAVRRFDRYCRTQGIGLPDRGFALSYSTDIPVQVGLAGSSAIVTGAVRSLMEHFGVEIDDATLPTLILEAETEELGISAGLMDRVIQVWGGLVHMELGRELIARRGHGRYERLDPRALPPLYLAWHADLAEGSEVTHDELRRRFERGDPGVLQTMNRLTELTEEGRKLLDAGRGRELGPLMDQNFDMRARICEVGEGDRKLVETGRRLGAHPKFAGSGGAVIASYDGDPERLERIRTAYRELGAGFVVPEL